MTASVRGRDVAASTRTVHNIFVSFYLAFFCAQNLFAQKQKPTSITSSRTLLMSRCRLRFCGTYLKDNEDIIRVSLCEPNISHFLIIEFSENK